ncbi:MAG: hypothetical protein HQL69_22065 [Magnetococcales bacterium]|nr:hypothetical protein [Magnetococcales bacterium]
MIIQFCRFSTSGYRRISGLMRSLTIKTSDQINKPFGCNGGVIGPIPALI